MSKFLLTKKNLSYLVLTILCFTLVQLLISFGVLNSYYQITLYTIGINIILALGLNLIIGFTGQFSLGHAGFMAIGAYASGVVTTQIPGYLGFFIGVFMGLIISAVFALIIAIPTLRLKGDYLAIATLGFGEIIRIIILNLEFTGGASGLSNIPKITSWPLVFAFIVITLVVIFNYIVSSHGRATISIKDDEIASESVGVNTTKYKTIAFILGGMFASIAGALYANFFYVLKPEIFSFTKSVDILVIVVLGGMGSLTGTVVSAVILGMINMFLQNFGALRMLIYSVMLICIMLFRPQGLLGNKELDLFSIIRKRGEENE